MTMLESYAARRSARRASAPEPAPPPMMAFSEGVILAGHDLQVRSANRAATELLGWSRSEDLVASLNADGWFAMAGNQHRQVRAALAHRRRWEGAVSLTARDGTRIDVVLTACVLHTTAGLPAGIVIVLRPLLAFDQRLTTTDGPTFRMPGLPGTFLLRYQPEVELATGVMTSCEALLRWRHPALGLVSPGATLSQPLWAMRLADLEDWAHRTAAAQAAAWCRADAPLRVTVNLSSRQLADPELPASLQSSLDASGLPAACLAVELSCSDVLLRPTLIRRVMGQLTDRHIAVIIDHVDDTVPERLIQGLQVSALKLAPSTTRAISSIPHHQETVASLVELAERLGASTVAGLVESVDDARALRSLGVDRAFGNLYSPPLPALELEAFRWSQPVDRLAPQSRLSLVP